VTQPVLHITSTHDATQPGALFVWEGALDHSPAAADHCLIFGPWDHHGAASSTQLPSLGGVDFTDAAVLDINEIHKRWFDRWLLGSGKPGAGWPRASVFFTGTPMVVRERRAAKGRLRALVPAQLRQRSDRGRGRQAR